MQGAEREHHVASHRHRLPPLKSYFRAGATAVLLSVVFFATFVFSTVTTTYAGHLNRVHSPRSARARPFQCPPEFAAQGFTAGPRGRPQTTWNRPELGEMAASRGAVCFAMIP
jgi:hypothetical protein